ncbi:CHAD domain-containing protein [bacterium]|nr:CHAD domain-containing protein [bacterium]
MTEIENLTLPESTNGQNVIHEIASAYLINKEPTQRKKRRFFDTFDWRLYHRGLILFKEARTYHLYDLQEARLIAISTPKSQSHPKFSWEFPEGTLRNTLQAIVDVRALLPVTGTETYVQRMRILNDDEKTVLRVQVEDVQAVTKRGRKDLGESIKLIPVRGYRREFQQFKRFLSRLHVERVSTDPLSRALSSAEKIPGEYSSKMLVRLNPNESASFALRKILSHLLQTMKQNEEGIKADLDTEFLHDFRVAVRRTRSALTQIKGVFRQSDVDRFSEDFVQLGKLTNRMRDLDVYLLKQDQYRHMLPDSLKPGLQSIFTSLRQERGEEHQKLIKALESRNYQKIVSDYRTFLNSKESDTGGKNRDKAIIKVARKVISHRYQAVISDGEKIHERSPDDELHSLRIQCKKLRYLMEFFASLFPKREINQLIKHLKRLQDNLGDFNDYYMQQETLKGFLSRSGSQLKETSHIAAAIGGLIALLNQKQRQTRELFDQAFGEFNAKESRHLFRKYFGELS